MKNRKILRISRFSGALILLFTATYTPADDLPTGFPDVTVTVDDHPSPGYLFLSNFSFTQMRENVPFLMVLDNSGYPVVAKEVEAPINLDLILQPDGFPTFHNGVDFVVLDSTLSEIGTYSGADSFTADGHECRVLENGHALILAWKLRTADMTAYGGRANALLQDMAIQEVDREGNLYWEWKMADHFDIDDTTPDIPLTKKYIDWVHSNALDIDTDGNLLLSSRHLDEITKIDRVTGDIIWRLGGSNCANNQFTFIDDDQPQDGGGVYVGFSHQHGVRRLPNGNLILFDNGNLKSPQYTRIVEYELDEEALTARKVWEYRHTPEIYSSEMGFAQRLENGNTLIGWGGNEPGPAVTEIDSAGSVVYEMTFAEDIVSYRAFRFIYLMDAVTRSIVAPGSYAFDDSTYRTALTLDIDSTGSADSITVERHRYAPHDAEFPAGSEPDTIFPWRWVIRGGETPPAGTVRIDLAALPAEADSGMAVALYRRAKEGEGTFEKLGSSCEAGAPFVEASFDSFGEFVVGALRDSACPVLTFVVGRNVPNPFNGETTIHYTLDAPGRVRILVYDVIGREVATLVDGEMPTGDHEVLFDGSDVAPGVYFSRFTLGRFEQTTKMILIR